MDTKGSILIIDQDSELVSILSAFLTASGYRVVFTTRVREALKKLALLKFAHIFIDPNLKPDDASKVLLDLTLTDSLNAKTALTILVSDGDFQVPMAMVKRIFSLLPKPFTLDEFAHHLATAVSKQASV